MNIAKENLRSRHPWIDAAPFEAMSQIDVLNQIIEIIDKNKKKPSSGVSTCSVVFDLDSTLFDVKSRSLRIAKEFARSPQASGHGKSLREWWLGLSQPSLLYTIDETAAAHGFPLDREEGLRYLLDLKKYWFERFFTSEYLLHDVPVPGAREFVRRVEDAGAHVVYLTGRDRPRMERGTRFALRHWGFPMHPQRTRLGMKPNFAMDDGEFKDSYLAELRAEARVLALFDNEPANFRAFEKNFPDAALVFRHATCSQKQAHPVRKVYKIHDFLT